MKVTTFQTVASKLANTIGRDRGVRVTFGGTGAWAVPGHIHLPALPAGTVLTPFEADLMRGYLDHEIGHIRHSNFKVLMDCGDELTKKPSLKTLWNWIEDVWQENKVLSEYAGSERFLGTTHSFMDEKTTAEVKQEQDAGVTLTMAALAMRLTYREIWKRRGLDRDVGSDVSLEDLGLGAVSEAIAEEFPLLRSTKNNGRLARRLHALLEEAVEEFEPPPSGGGEEDEEGEEGEDDQDGGGAGGGSGDGDQESDGAGSGAENGDQDGDQEGSGAGRGNGLDRDAKPTEAGDLDAAADKPEHQRLLEEILERVVGKNARDEKRGKGRGRKRGLGTPVLVAEEDEADPDNPGEYVMMRWEGDDYLPPAGTDHDKIFVPSHENMVTYRRDRAAMDGQISSIKKALTIFLRSKEMRAWTRGLEEGRLDDDLLADLCATDNQRVFKERRIRQFPNTAFAVIGDLSSSMNAHLVRLSMIAFVEALAQLTRIKTLVAGFRTNHHTYDPVPGCGRLDGVDLLLYKDFDEPYRSAMGRLGAIGTGGATPLGDGYGYGFEALVKRHEARKVLLLLSDGEPYYNWGAGGRTGSSHNDYALMRHVHEKCETYGIETLGIGVASSYGAGGEALREYVDRFEMIRSSADLARAVLEMTKRVVVPC